jgi:hypothetical protein
MFRTFLTGTLVATLLMVPTQVVDAQAAKGCQPGQTPHFAFGFAELKDQIGDDMGDPLTCEFADPSGSGDIHQQTTTGLAFWRKSTNTPTFTDGFDHWAQTPQGWVTWTGASIDPPTASANTYPDSVVQGFLQGCTNVNPDSPELAAACSCAIQQIENSYTLGDFLNITAQYLQQGSFPPDFVSVIATCTQPATSAGGGRSG